MDSTPPNQRDAVKLLARLGYASRGVVYLLVGGLAALAAFSQGGQTEGSRGALESVLTAPLRQSAAGHYCIGVSGLCRMAHAASPSGY